MSRPFTVDAVGMRTLATGLDVVGASVGDRLAGTLVVDAGNGEPLARLLLSGPVVGAARKAVALHRGVGGLEAILGALDELAAAITAVDGRDLAQDEMPSRRLEPVPPRAVVHGVDPAKAIVESNNRLFYGNPEGKAGNSVFRGTAVAGVVLIPTPRGSRPRAYGVFEGASNALECWEPLSRQLREMAEGIDRQLAAAGLVRGL